MDNSSFLGRGWSFPPSFGAEGNDVHMVSNEEDIRQSLEILLSTRMQERTLLPDFGSALGDFLFDEMDQYFSTQITEAITNAILRYEPRITLESVIVQPDNERDGLLLLHISYVIKTINSRFNMVYPFYLHETAR